MIYNIAEIIHKLCISLNISIEKLASLIGKTHLIGISKQESDRLIRIFEVVEYMKFYDNQLTPKDLYSILVNERVVLVPPYYDVEEDEIDISLIGYIEVYPKDKGWISVVEKVIKNWRFSA